MIVYWKRPVLADFTSVQTPLYVGVVEYSMQGCGPEKK